MTPATRDLIVEGLLSAIGAASQTCDSFGDLAPVLLQLVRRASTSTQEEREGDLLLALNVWLEVEKARLAGKNAFREGKLRSDCPYEELSLFCRLRSNAWHEGFEAYRREWEDSIGVLHETSGFQLRAEREIVMKLEHLDAQHPGARAAAADCSSRALGRLADEPERIGLFEEPIDESSSIVLEVRLRTCLMLSDASVRPRQYELAY